MSAVLDGVDLDFGVMVFGNKVASALAEAASVRDENILTEADDVVDVEFAKEPEFEVVWSSCSKSVQSKAAMSTVR